MRVVKVTEVEAALEPAAFEDRKGKLHVGKVASYPQYRRVLRLTGSIDKQDSEATVRTTQQEILETLGFDEEGVRVALDLSMVAFFAVIEDFFRKNRTRHADADGTESKEPPAPTLGTDSPPAAND